MYKGYWQPVSTLLNSAAHQFCWFHINCFHIGATVRRSKKDYERALKALEAFDKNNKGPLDEQKQAERNALRIKLEFADRLWGGALRFQRMLLRVLRAPNYELAVARLERLIRVGLVINNPYPPRGREAQYSSRN